MAGDEYGQHKCPRRLLFCLSDLPDAILLHILSFLPTKSVVATSLLSRRWQHLWNHTPNLQFHESQFINKQRRRQNFVNFAERALGVRGGSSLVSLSLSCKVKKDAFRINTWITSAIQCKVEQLSLYLRASRSFSLPCCIFGCHTLVKLDMETNGQLVRVPSSMVCLPRLKHLRLKKFAFVDEKSTEDLLSHPLLEDLTISHCYWDKRIRTVNVNSPKLQRLSIDDFSNHSSEDRQVCFVGDHLKSFRYKGTFLPTQYCISGSTTQLRDAEILVQFQSPVVSESYYKLVKCLSRVQNLTLSPYTISAFDDLVQCPKMQTTIPVFEHLTQLNLADLAETEPIDIDSMSLRVIFERCPHLEYLNIMTELEGGSTLRPIPSNFLINLKKISVHFYDPEVNDDAIDVLLHSAPVLEEMVLHWFEDGSYFDSSYCSSEVETLESELNRRPKFSDMCRIYVILELF